MNEVPLAVDLDGTLIQGDVTEQAFLDLLFNKPWKALTALLVLIFKGNLAFKIYLAENSQKSSFNFNFNPQFFEFLKAEKEKGRYLLLISASPQKLVELVKPSLFNEAIGSSDINLRGSNKASYLIRRFQLKGFDYAGNATPDFKVFEKCRKPILVGAHPSLTKEFRRQYPYGEVFDPHPSKILTILKALRLHQWAKNILIFVAPVLGKAFSLDTVFDLIASFIGFSLVCSSSYVLNDLADIDKDRAHSKKRFRPFASGRLNVWIGLALSFLSLVAGVTMNFYASQLAGLLALSYFLLSSIYSFKLKTIPVVDIFALQVFYLTRVYLGAIVSEVVVSNWLLIFSMFGFLSVSAAKRVSEILGEEKTLSYKARGYLKKDLNFLTNFGLISGVLCSLVYLFYLNSDQVVNRYSNPTFLWLIFPLILYWFSYLWLVVFRGASLEDPVIFMFSSKSSLFVLLLAGLCLYFAY